MTSRCTCIERNTNETRIKLELNLEGKGEFSGTSGIGFLDHMLELFTKHSGFDISLDCKGDLHIDTHHLVEDLGIVLGKCLAESLGDKRGINRYGSFRVPMDESLIYVDLDLSGRGYLVYNVELKREKVGDFECEMLKEFLYALAINGGMNLHVNLLYGDNDHHKIEGVFKGLARSLKIAVTIEQGNDSIPSSKGVLI